MPSFDVTAYLDAWRRRDFDRILDLHADSLTLEDPVRGQLAWGKEELRRRMELGASHVSEITFEPRRVLQQGREVAALLHMGVAYVGEVPLPDGGTLDLDGKRLELDVGMFLVTDEDGKVVEQTWLYDVASAARQMGYSAEDLERIRQQAVEEHARPT